MAGGAIHPRAAGNPHHRPNGRQVARHGRIPSSEARHPVTRSSRSCSSNGLDGHLPLMAILGPLTREALSRFEQTDIVDGTDVRHDRVRVSYSTGLRETWGSSARRSVGSRCRWLPGGSTNPLQPRSGTPSISLTGRIRRGRPLVRLQRTRHRAALRVLRPKAPRPSRRPPTRGGRLDQARVSQEALAQDLARLRADPRCFAVTKGYMRGQPGRATTPPPGFLLANHLRIGDLCMRRAGPRWLKLGRIRSVCTGRSTRWPSRARTFRGPRSSTG